MHALRILLLLLITFNLYAQEKNVLLKINPIKGESTVTSISNQKAIEKILAEGFLQKGYQVFTKETISSQTAAPQEELLLADAFIYQYPGDYPSITLTIRKGDYIFAILHDNKKLFVERQSALEAIAGNLVQELPTAIQESTFLLPELEQLLPHHNMSIYTATSGAITKGYANQYLTDFKTTGSEPLNFILKDSFEQYLALCLDFTGYRKAIKETPIRVDFEIDAFGFTNLTNITLPASVKESHKDKIKNTIEALPLWNLANRQPIKGTLTLGVRK
ncbi:hypothetical protein ACFSC6_16955 [Rufibacter sediminis]|uniref:POTRA domain-containing protein n=1 Tax=Rufibacter sediminis TaxID=2762756 RepID=A0ABR6VTC3_9BACT|nr:hypothetical protein [Rufibacter sediminis]MBC3540098.1 hypothetical protein [Rufibacter sediminis]